MVKASESTDDSIITDMTDKSLKRIGIRLQAARRLKDLTQQQIADKVGISRTYYVQIEHGKRDPSTTVITAAAEAVGLSVSDLLK